MIRKTKPLAEVPLAERDLKALIDDLGETQRLYRLWVPQVNPHAKRQSELLAELDRRYQSLAPEKQETHDGHDYQLLVKPCEERHPVTAAAKRSAFYALQEAKKNPFEIFDLTLTAMRQHLGQGFVDANVPGERTGPRNFVVTALAKASTPVQPAKPSRKKK